MCKDVGARRPSMRQNPSMVLQNRLWLAFLALALIILSLPVIRQSSMPEERSFDEVRNFLADKLNVIDSFHFGDETGRWTLQNGFTFSEKDGTWMSDSIAEIRFRIPDPVDDSSIRFTVIPFLPNEATSRTIMVSTAGVQRQIVLSRGLSTFTLELPEAVSQWVEFRCGPLSSPTALGDSLDMRPLCVKVIRAEIVRGNSAR